MTAYLKVPGTTSHVLHFTSADASAVRVRVLAAMTGHGVTSLSHAGGYVLINFAQAAAVEVTTSEPSGSRDAPDTLVVADVNQIL
jgi:hypothetical protein